MVVTFLPVKEILGPRKYVIYENFQDFSGGVLAHCVVTDGPTPVSGDCLTVCLQIIHELDWLKISS